MSPSLEEKRTEWGVKLNPYLDSGGGGDTFQLHLEIFDIFLRETVKRRMLAVVFDGTWPPPGRPGITGSSEFRI